MKVIISAQAEEDLAGLFNFIKSDLHNTSAAANIVDKIFRLTVKLHDFLELGVSLKPISELSIYRYLIADNYLIIYKVIDQEVSIVRILYARSDYVQLLRGSLR